MNIQEIKKIPSGQKIEPFEGRLVYIYPPTIKKDKNNKEHSFVFQRVVVQDASDEIQVTCWGAKSERWLGQKVKVVNAVRRDYQNKKGIAVPCITSAYLRFVDIPEDIVKGLTFFNQAQILSIREKSRADAVLFYSIGKRRNPISTSDVLAVADIFVKYATTGEYSFPILFNLVPKRPIQDYQMGFFQRLFALWVNNLITKEEIQAKCKLFKKETIFDLDEKEAKSIFTSICREKQIDEFGG